MVISFPWKANPPESGFILRSVYHNLSTESPGNALLLLKYFGGVKLPLDTGKNLKYLPFFEQNWHNF